MNYQATAQEQLLRFIYEVDFALDDVGLFLDTHPTDSKALEYYNQYKTLLHEAMKEYSENYGPLLQSDVNSENKWAWVSEPWPWEGVY